MEILLKLSRSFLNQFFPPQHSIFWLFVSLMLQLLCLVLVTVHATFGLQYVLQTGKVLFPEWNVKKWEQVDDSIRGGKSVSHLSGNKTVLFYGNVDTTTLGGAG